MEIGRRVYEYNLQYIVKEKKSKKNIIQPDIKLFYDRFIKSMEEIGIQGEKPKDWIALHYFLKDEKNSNIVVRVPFESCKTFKSLKMKSSRSLVKIYKE